jgi:hypothetical protein
MENERPIIFSGEMVRAILEGRKTQTRRVIKPQPYALIDDWPYVDNPIEVVDEKTHRTKKVFSDEHMRRFVKRVACPYGQVGDRLWVRETWAPGVWLNQYDDLDPGYRASWAQMARNTNFMEPRWRPSIHMPRWASRITLEVVGVRVERVQEISYADALAEGVWRPGPYADPDQVDREYDARDQYSHLWDEINARRGYSWASNPLVWVVEFRRV